MQERSDEKHFVEDPGPHPALPHWRRSSLLALLYILWQLHGRYLAVVLRVRALMRCHIACVSNGHCSAAKVLTMLAKHDMLLAHCSAGAQ